MKPNELREPELDALEEIQGQDIDPTLAVIAALAPEGGS